MTIYEIDQAIMECVDLETGEIIDTEQLDKLQMERDAKLENVACWIKDLKAEAEALKAEISQSFLCDIEQGRSKPSIDTALKIAEALNIDDIKFFETE